MWWWWWWRGEGGGGGEDVDQKQEITTVREREEGDRERGHPFWLTEVVSGGGSNKTTKLFCQSLWGEKKR